MRATNTNKTTANGRDFYYNRNNTDIMVCRYTMVMLLWAFTATAQIHIKPVNLPSKATIQITDMHFPVDGVLVSGHGWRNGRIHHGLDISRNNRDTVRSAWTGRVRYAKKGHNGGYGYLVIITHLNGLETYYAHLRELLVKDGDWVKKGRPVGIVGSTGHSSGPHLHFEVRYKGLSIDPQDIVDKRILHLELSNNIFKVR
jgi:murein DD-endopeptidase MepM/ murein hydrolase activator NlpD